jgi:hypothetical protein
LKPTTFSDRQHWLFNEKPVLAKGRFGDASAASQSEPEIEDLHRIDSVMLQSIDE